MNNPIPGDGPSNTPDESSLLRPLGDDLNVTARMLRLEEDELFTKERYSMDPGGDSYYIRDFNHLCRGIKLVRYSMNRLSGTSQMLSP